MARQKKLQIAGLFHPINLIRSSRKSLAKLFNEKKGVELQGVFVAEDNTIYLANDLSAEEALHVLLHELWHATEYAMQRLESEEARCDVMAGYLAKLISSRDVEQFIQHNQVLPKKVSKKV